MLAGRTRFILTSGDLARSWRFRKGGLFRINLPGETLEAARPNLEDLRIIDSAGREVPFIIDRPIPQIESAVPVKEFHPQLEASVTRLNIVTGTKAVIRGILLEAPRQSEFIKPVRVEGSHDGRSWRQLADHEPVFRMAGGATKLRIPVSEGAWEFLRLTIDDSRSAPVPFSGVELETGALAAPTEPIAVTIQSRDENPGTTRLALNLGRTNLTPASLHIECADALFARTVTVAIPVVQGDDLTEEPLVSSVIYRMDVGGKTESHLDVAVDQQVATRQLLLLIANGDSPPLAITGIKAERRLVNIVFSAGTGGSYTLLSGNDQGAAPNYDLGRLAQDLKNAQSKPIMPSAVARNPDYKAADALAAVALRGAAIDPAPWKFRKSVNMSGPGVQQIELDLEILAHATRDLRDLRLVSDGRQIPFILERTSIAKAIPLVPVAADDPKRPTVSRWSLKLPDAGLPITRLVCRLPRGVFQRELRLSETVNDTPEEDERQIVIGSASVSQKPNEKPRDIVLELSTAPRTSALILETDNGDNPPIQIDEFRAYYPVTRIVFKYMNESALPWLYYGNAEAPAARYDLSLVAKELLRAERSAAFLGPQEVIRGKGVLVGDTLSGWSRYIFWAVLAILVVGLLLLIARLVPKVE